LPVQRSCDSPAGIWISAFVPFITSVDWPASAPAVVSYGSYKCHVPFASFVVGLKSSDWNTGGAELTVSVAALLVAVPPALLTTQRYCDPLSPSTVAGVV